MESVEGWKAGDTGYLVVLLPPHKDTEGAKQYWRCNSRKELSKDTRRNFFAHFFLIIYLETLQLQDFG
jgi:hypothetical protein